MEEDQEPFVLLPNRFYRNDHGNELHVCSYIDTLTFGHALIGEMHDAKLIVVDRTPQGAQGWTEIEQAESAWAEPEESEEAAPAE